jgi:broad specificity phosphatase PhoE
MCLSCPVLLDTGLVGTHATLILVRHAHTDCTSNGHNLLCGRYDSGISPLGWLQVTALRQRLRSEGPFSAAYTSPLKRAIGTASAAPAQLQPRILHSLAEIDCGRLDGLPLSHVQREYSDLWRRNCAQADPNFRWPDGESYARFRRRVLRAVHRIALRNQGERVLLFTHAGVINQIIGSVVGQSAARWENYRPANAALTELVFDGQNCEIVRFDDREHLSVANAHPPS